MSTQGTHSCCVAHLALQLRRLKVMFLNANHILSWVSQVMLVVKNLPANAGDIRDPGSIPGLGRSPGGGNGSPFQYSCLENPTHRGDCWATVHRVAKSQTWLKQLHTHPHIHVINRRKFRGHPLFMSYLIYIVSYQQSLQFFLVCVATMLLPPVCCQNRSIMFSTALCDLDVD